MSPSRLIEIIEDFLKNPANSSSRLYGIFIEQLHQLASVIQEDLDSRILEKSKQQKSHAFYKSAKNDTAEDTELATSSGSPVLHLRRNLAGAL